jgi:hypothetical protein
MAELFDIQCEDGMHITKTLYVWKPVSKALLNSLMDPGWDVKREASDDVIKCSVAHDTVCFRYHIGRQVLYTSFAYYRERCIKGEWTPMDLRGTSENMRTLNIELLDGSILPMDVGRKWLIRNIREEVGYSMVENVKWVFGIVKNSKPEEWNKVGHFFKCFKEVTFA